MKCITSARCYPRQSSLLCTNQTTNKYGTKRANMVRETNKGVMMRCKTITAKLLTVVRLLVEPITPLAKPKASLEESLSIRQPY